LQDGKRISFLFLPAEHDPDSYIREFGTADFEQRISAAVPLSAYLLRELSAELDLDSQEGRNQLLQRAKPLLTAIVAPATALLLRKEIAARCGVTQAELEALYQVRPVARAARAGPQKIGRAPPSALRRLLQCLIAQPALGRQMPGEWHTEGADAEAIQALLLALREVDYDISSAALAQFFQGTSHEKIFVEAQTETLNWGENFDVATDFNAIVSKFDEKQRQEQFQLLQAKLGQGGLASLSDAERAQYLLLLQRDRPDHPAHG
jgi:DNA primase